MYCNGQIMGCPRQATPVLRAQFANARLSKAINNAETAHVLCVLHDKTVSHWDEVLCFVAFIEDEAAIKQLSSTPLHQLVQSAGMASGT